MSELGNIMEFCAHWDLCPCDPINLEPLLVHFPWVSSILNTAGFMRCCWNMLTGKTKLFGRPGYFVTDESAVAF